jgi:hypothetical chaperone protein
MTSAHAIGFDYGTTKCSIAYSNNQQVQAIPFAHGGFYTPSTLSAPTRESVSEYLYRQLNVQPITKESEALLSRALNVNKQNGIEVGKNDVLFGDAATQEYLKDPTELYYVKSPKSFLGLLGLRTAQLAVFEDLVCAMMANVKQQAEQHLQQDINQVMIGRPVNFHNTGGERSNKQAIGILTNAAKRAGFKDIDFLFEPVAAGLEFESTLTEEKLVLVVDIGGGTSDCSMLKMGPQWVNQADRSDSMIAHLGKMVGGNDLDIAIAFKRFMTEFGKDSENLNNKPIPTMLYWEAMAINDVIAQRNFYAHDNLSELQQVVKNAKQPELLARLLAVYQNTLSYSIVHQAEKTKIHLGTNPEYTAALDLIDEMVNVGVTFAEMDDAIQTPIRKIKTLVDDTIKQAGCLPDVVYVTGGSSQSPIIRDAINEVLPNTPIASGDFDASVTSGLARWAEVRFR